MSLLDVIVRLWIFDWFGLKGLTTQDLRANDVGQRPARATLDTTRLLPR